MSNFNIAEKFYEGAILIPHHEHPVFHCFHDDTFNCNVCKKAFTIEKEKDSNINKTGCFCCTLCNVDICDICFGEIELYKIVFYDDPNIIKNKDKFNNTLELSDRGWKKFKCHTHSMPLIIKGSDQFGWNYECSACHRLYVTYNPQDQNMENIFISKYLYYCSLCNYCLCCECAEKNIIKKNENI